MWSLVYPDFHPVFCFVHLYRILNNLHCTDFHSHWSYDIQKVVVMLWIGVLKCFIWKQNGFINLLGIIQKKSASRSQTLPCLMIFFQNFILIWKCQKVSLSRGTLVWITAIYETNRPFRVLSALFLFFQMLPCDSKLFPGLDNHICNICCQKCLLPPYF